MVECINACVASFNGTLHSNGEEKTMASCNNPGESRTHSSGCETPGQKSTFCVIPFIPMVKMRQKSAAPSEENDHLWVCLSRLRLL